MANVYKPQYLKEIDRYAVYQTIETMFANKLVAVIDRYEKFKTIAGRDIYDIHHFFSRGYDYSKAVIEERRKASEGKYLRELIDFIDKKVTNKIISQDLNYLLSAKQFKAIKNTLKDEVGLFER